MRILGHISAKVTLHNPDKMRTEHVELFVDTGSTYTWFSTALLKKLGVETKTARRFKTIDGRLLERSVGEVLVECLNEKATTIVVFGEKGDAEGLGVHALEGLGLEVDPATKQLRKAEAPPAL